MGAPPPCHKVRHADEAAAIRHLKDRKRSTRENKKLANKLNIYWCWQCEAFHIGHNRLKGKQYPSPSDSHFQAKN
jgi:hypothetical protein